MPHPLEVAEAALLFFLLVAEGTGLWAVVVEAGHLWEVAAEVGPWPVVAAMRLLVLEVAV